jgi:hypothetical protein
MGCLELLTLQKSRNVNIVLCYLDVLKISSSHASQTCTQDFSDKDFVLNINSGSLKEHMTKGKIISGLVHMSVKFNN